MSALETLVEPAQLHAHLDDPDWVIVDCRFELSRPSAGHEAYLQGHIPGAYYAHLDEDLSGPLTPATGRHPLPRREAFARKMARWGISPGKQVVAYDEANGAIAARLWWLLRWMGHPQVAVLNGGFRAWVAAGYPVTTEVPDEKNEPLAPGEAALESWLTSEQTQRGLEDGSIVLIDARGADRFAGQNETLDRVAGHIPGARNHPFATNLDADLRFLPGEQLRERWLKTLRGAAPEAVVCMCGSGVTACHNLLAMHIAGLKGARLYAGSWSEWITDPRRPVSTDPNN